MPSASLAALLSVALLSLADHASADGFSTGIQRTKCNLDASRAQVNNPCPSLYNAECDGSYCRCPRGQVEDPNLRRCVQGDDADDDLFSDLPFDYVPPGQNTTPRPRHQPAASSVDVSNTRCTAGNDPCPSLHSAVCSHGFCSCPQGFMQDPSRAVCRRDNSPTHSHDDHDHDDHDHDDHDNHDHDHDWFSSKGSASNAGPVSLVTSLLVCALLGRH